MAVVKTYDSYFGKIRHRVKVKCSASDGMFSIELPGAAEPLLGKTIKAETLLAVEDKYREASRRFKQASSKEQKVIIVKFDDEVSFGKGIAFDLACGVYIKRVWSGEFGSIDYKLEDSTLPDEVEFDTKLWPSDVEANCVELPWTEDREQFMVAVANAFIELVARMNKFCASERSFLDFMKVQKVLPAWREPCEYKEAQE